MDRAARRVLTQKAELGLLDADWSPEVSVAAVAEVDLDSSGNRALARELAEKSDRATGSWDGVAAAGRRPTGAAPGGRGRAVCCRSADPDGLLLLPQPRAAPASRAGSGDRGDQRPGRAAGGATRRRGDSRSGLRGDRRRPVRVRGSGRRDAGGRSVRGVRRGSRGLVRPRHLGGGLRCRGPAASRRPGGPGRSTVGKWHSGCRGGGIRPPVRAGERVRAGGWIGPGVHAGRGGWRGDRRRTLRADHAERQAAGADPAASGRPAGDVPATAARGREQRHQQSRSHPVVRLRARALVHQLRVGRPADQRTRGADRWRVHGRGAAGQYRCAGRARRSCSSICTMWWRR